MIAFALIHQNDEPMRSFFFTTLSIICMAAALGLFTGCGEDASKESNVVRIGFAGVMTGPEGGDLGTDCFNGARLAVEEWNAKGGVLGKKIEVVERDDEGKPAQAVAVANDLCAQGIVVLFGHINSGCTIPASPIYDEHGIVQMTLSSNPEVTERGLGTLFRCYSRDDQEGRFAAEFAYQSLTLRKMAVMHNKTAYGQGVAEEFKKRFEELGGEVVLFTGIGSEELDFRANITSIQTAGADGLFFGGLYSQSGPLINQLRQAGVAIPFLSGNGSFHPSLATVAGADVQNLYVIFGPDYKKMPSAQPFLKKYHDRFGPEKGFSIYGYDAVNILLTAIEKAGKDGDEKVKGSVPDSRKIIDTLRTTRFETCIGPIEFDNKGDLKQGNFVIWTVKKGEFTPYVLETEIEHGCKERSDPPAPLPTPKNS